MLPVVSTRHSRLEFQAPDLSASRLYLVETRLAGSGAHQTVAMHYRGMRGCRLTVVAIETAGTEPEPQRDAAESEAGSA